ncbi:unnamed protein product [Periconia digitata]|uniref:Uncharacterized protein n=1 Tax=Periconia digitata TaxID=1303443 RepID=A0A9W4UKI3_9PLEO|nr:unnamed protein product [Periconia digitata]
MCYMQDFRNWIAYYLGFGHRVRGESWMEESWTEECVEKNKPGHLAPISLEEGFSDKGGHYSTCT